LLFLYFTLFRPFIGAATSSITWFNSGGDEAICAVGDAAEVAEPLAAGCVDEKFGDVKEQVETASNPDPLGSLDEDDSRIEEDKDGEETEDLGEFTADPASDDDLTPFIAGDQSPAGDEDGTNAGEEEKPTSEADSDHLQFYLSPDDTEEEKQKSGSFPWSRWGDEIKDKLSF